MELKASLFILDLVPVSSENLVTVNHHAYFKVYREFSNIGK